ncbi:DUF5060 domain-containing protein, partial [Candidatus Hydrogenedentota bacterium]
MRSKYFYTLCMACTAIFFAGMAEATLAVAKDPSSSVDIGRHDAFELTLTHDDAAYRNAFWNVLIEVTFTSPGGVDYAVEGFYYDVDTWKVRFAPTALGVWTYDLTMTGNSDTYTTTGSFNCTASTTRGHVRVHPDNPKRMIFADGSHFNPIGTNIWAYRVPFLNEANVAGSTYYERWSNYFAEYEAHKCNVYRRLIGTEKAPPQHMGVWRYDAGLGVGKDKYNLALAKELDDEFRSATDHNMAIVAALYDKGRAWNSNPLNSINGGPLSDDSGLYDITNTTVTDLHKKYIRYM